MRQQEQTAPTLTVLKNDDIERLKQFKRSKRLKRKAKRIARISEQSTRETELRQHKQWFRLPSLDAQVVCKLVGIALTIIGLLIIARNAWQQGDNDTDRWISVGRDMILEIGMSVSLLIVIIKWRQRQWVLSLMAVCVCPCLGYYALQNNDQWTRSANANVLKAKQDASEKELLNKPDVALKKQTLDIALADKTRKEADAKTQCSQNDGTKCTKAKQEASKASVFYQQRREAYDDALSEAKREATETTRSVAVSEQSLQIRMLLPILGAIFLMLGSSSDVRH
jgi:hypothetical protein